MPTWTKVHFDTLAKMLNDEYKYHLGERKSVRVIDEMADRLHSLFKKENPNYNPDIWFEAIYRIYCEYCKHICTDTHEGCENCFHNHVKQDWF